MARAYKIFIVLLAVVSAYLCYNIVRMHILKVNLDFAPQGFFSGPEDAETTIVEFLDYSCIKCRQSHPGLKAYLERNRNVRYIPRPILSTTDSGKEAGKFVFAAGLQGQFLEAHELLLQSDKGISQDLFDEIILTLELDAERMKVDMVHPNITKLLKYNSEYNGRLGSPTIPTYYINNEVLWVINDPNRIPDTQDFETIINQVRNSQ